MRHYTSFRLMHSPIRRRSGILTGFILPLGVALSSGIALGQPSTRPSALPESFPDPRIAPTVPWFELDRWTHDGFVFAIQAYPIWAFLMVLLLRCSRGDLALWSVGLYLFASIAVLVMTGRGWLPSPPPTLMIIAMAGSVVYAAVEAFRDRSILPDLASAVLWAGVHGFNLAVPLGRVLGPQRDARMEEEVRPFAVGVGAGLAVMGLAALALRPLWRRFRTASEARFGLGTMALGAACVFGFMNLRSVGAMSCTEAEELLIGLHRQIYWAFNLTDEGEIYDILEKCMASDLLDETYQSVLESLEFVDGYRVSMEIDRLLPSTIRIRENHADRLVIDYCWIVSGRVFHFADSTFTGKHVHNRTNKFVARYRVEPRAGGWRIVHEEYLVAEQIDSAPVSATSAATSKPV